MLTVKDYGEIRRAYRDKMSIRDIARTFHRSRRKIREVLANPEPRPYTRSKEPYAPKLGRFKPLIDQILKDDERAPRKQRHTATQIFRRLAKEGYQGGYDQVRRYVAKRRRPERETFIPLIHDPGQRAEADFGRIYVDFPEGRQPVHVLLLIWAYSYCPFAIALPTERVEAILHGMACGFEFFGCVPKEVWWDNPTTVAIEILTGRQRKLNDRYSALASHYNFEPLFCMPARGNEKPHVENRVKNLQRRWATPVPRMQDLAELNEYLRRCCLEDRQRVASGQSEPIGRRFERDRRQAVELPAWPFDACIAQPRKVDKYQTIAFDKNRYSVPRHYAFQTVTVKGYVEHVDVVAESQVIARHERCYQSGQQILDPIHFLATLRRKPACLDHAAVFRDWKLPPIFDRLRRTLEEQHGPMSGPRRFIRVLQLLAEHPVERVARAIESCQAWDGLAVDLIIQRTEHLRERDSTDGTSLEQTSTVPQVGLPLPDLSHFDQFLSIGDHDDAPGSKSSVAAEGQPEAVTPSNDACRV